MRWIFYKYFLPVCGLPSHSLDIVFHRAKVLMKPSLSVISFIDYAFGGKAKKSSSYPKSYRFSPMLSSRSFIVLHFTFRYVINFEFIFVKGVRSVSRFIFKQMDIQLFQHHLLKILSLFHCIAFTPLSKIS